MKIYLVDGSSKEVTLFFEDGAFICPYCEYPVMAGETECQNPGCWTAFKTLESLQAAQAKYNKEKAEQAERERIFAIRNKAYGKNSSN